MIDQIDRKAIPRLPWHDVTVLPPSPLFYTQNSRIFVNLLIINNFIILLFNCCAFHQIARVTSQLIFWHVC
jgi:hypothetical protein